MSGLGPVCLGGGAAVPLHQGPRHKRRAMCALLIFKLSLASFQQSEKYRSTSSPRNTQISIHSHGNTFFAKVPTFHQIGIRKVIGK